MAIRPDWTAGTLTLVAGSKDFTTTGSALETAALQAGDAIITVSGYVLIVEAITGQNSGTLYAECPVAAAGSNQPLRIRYQPDGSRVQGAMRMVRELLTSGNLEAFAALLGRPNAVPVFSGFGALSLMDTDMLGGGAAGGWDATVFDRAGLDAYADRPAGYRVMVIDTGEVRSAVFQKQTEITDDRSQPIYFTGKDGKTGEQGAAGNDFEPDVVGLLSERTAHDNEPKGFAFLATDTAALYFRQGAKGEWSAPIPFGAGKPGEKGDDELSAYQVTVQEGFVGTQTEWIASLKGRDGNPGGQGDPGKGGEPGQKGDPGKNGTDASVTEQSIRSAGGSIKDEVDEALAVKGATAWVNFDGLTAGYPIRGSYNVASITRLAVGVYQVVFINPMHSSNYSCISTAGSVGNAAPRQTYTPHDGRLINSVRIVVVSPLSGNNLDAENISVAVFGG